MEIIALLVKSPLIAVLVSILLALVYLWLIILRRHEVI